MLWKPLTMINLNDLINKMKGGQEEESQQIQIPLEKIDLFINRCIEEKGYNCRILFQEIQQHLQSNGIHNMIHDAIYNLILQRLRDRINKGES